MNTIYKNNLYLICLSFLVIISNSSCIDKAEIEAITTINHLSKYLHERDISDKAKLETNCHWDKKEEKKWIYKCNITINLGEHPLDSLIIAAGKIPTTVVQDYQNSEYREFTEHECVMKIIVKKKEYGELLLETITCILQASKRQVESLKKFYVPSVGAYSHSGFLFCMTYGMRENLKSFFTGKAVELTVEEKEALKNIIPMVLCEGMRNPEAFVTLPMCMEIWDRIWPDMEQEIRIVLEKDASKGHLEVLERMRKIRISHIEKDLSDSYNEESNINAKKYLETNFERISNVFPQHILLTLFPMSLQGAVSGSNFIKKFLEIRPFVDNTASGKVQQILKTEAELMKFYKKIVLENEKAEFDADTFCRNWYGIEGYTNPDGDFKSMINLLLKEVGLSETSDSQVPLPSLPLVGASEDASSSSQVATTPTATTLELAPSSSGERRPMCNAKGVQEKKKEGWKPSLDPDLRK